MKKSREIFIGIFGVLGTVILIVLGLWLNFRPEVDNTIPRAPQASQAVDNNFSVRDAITALNRYRATQGQPGLIENNTLDYLAQSHATDMRDNHYYSHTDLSGKNAAQRVAQSSLGPVYAGENQDNMCYNTPISIEMGRFQGSPEHNANMLDPKYNAVGVGIVFSEDNTCNGYLVYDFAQL